MSLTIIDGFDNRSNNPLDAKYIVPNVAALSAIVFKHKGIWRWVEAEQNIYVLQNDLNTWRPLTVGQGVKRWIAGSYKEFNLVLHGGALYESQVNNNVSTPGVNSDWVKILGQKGDPGEPGNGKSAYQIWLDEGNSGSVSVFLQSLKGANGESISYWLPDTLYPNLKLVRYGSKIYESRFDDNDHEPGFDEYWRVIAADGASIDDSAAFSYKTWSSQYIADNYYSQTVSDLRYAPLVHTHAISDVTGLSAALTGKAALSHTHVVADITDLLDSGVIKASLLPSYVDDVLEKANFASLPVTGESGKIYVVLAAGTDGISNFPANSQFRWTGSNYIRLVASPGTTDNVPEGSVNLYHTTARVHTVGDGRYLQLTGGTLTGALTGTTAVFSNTTAYTKGNLATAGFVFGNTASATGSSVFVHTGSFSSAYASGLAISGTYSGGLSTIQLRAVGTNQGGGYASALQIILDNDGSERTHAIFSSDASSTFYGLGSSGNVIVGATNTGLLQKWTIGSGLSLVGTTLSATGGSVGTVTGTGTSGYHSKWTGSSSQGNSIVYDNGTSLTVGSGQNSAIRIGINGSDWAEVGYSGGLTYLYNGWGSTSAVIAILANSVGIRIFGTGNVAVNSVSDPGVKFYVNGSASVGAFSASTGTFSSTISASNFSGSHSGSSSGTNTGDQTNISGNSGTATLAANSTLWNGAGYSGSLPTTIQYTMVYDNTAGAFRIANLGQMQAFLGLGSAAYVNSNQHLTTSSTVTFASVTGSGGGFDSDLTLKNVITRDLSDRYIAGKISAIVYEWKTAQGEYRVGYGAQEIQEIFPDAVYTVVGKGTLAVDYTQVHTLLLDEHTKRIQELELRVEDLQRRLAA